MTTFDSDNSGQDRPQIAGMDDGLLRSRLREMPNEELCGLLREAALPVLVSYDEIQTQTAIGHEAMARLIERSGSRSGSLRPQSLQASEVQSTPEHGNDESPLSCDPAPVDPEASALPDAPNSEALSGSPKSGAPHSTNGGATRPSPQGFFGPCASNSQDDGKSKSETPSAEPPVTHKTLTFSLMLSRALRGETPYIYGVSIQRDGYLERVVATVTALSSPHAIQQVTEQFPQGMEITLTPANVFVGIQRFVAHPCRAARWIFSHREMASREYKAVLSVLGIQAVKRAWKEIQHGLAPGIGPVATDTQAASSLPDHEAAAPVTVRNPISTDEHAAN